MLAVDPQLGDQQAKERFGLLRRGFGDHALELVGDHSQVGGRRPLSGLVARLGGDFGLLVAKLVESRVEARRTLLATLGAELALLEGLVVAGERLLGAGDLGADRAQTLLALRALADRLLLGLSEGGLDQLAAAVDVGELGEDSCFELGAG